MQEHHRPFAQQTFWIVSLRLISSVLFSWGIVSFISPSLKGNNHPYFSTINDPLGSYQFFENQYYKLSRTSGDLYISEQIGDMNVSSEVFPTRASTANEYTFFQPTASSPRQFIYFDPSDHDFNGTISVIPYEEKGLIVSNDLSLDDFFGYQMVINDWNETIISAPGKNSDNGRIYVFNRNSNFELSQDYFLDPEIGDEGWWGASLNISGDYLFIGSPNSSSLGGKLLVYQRVSGVYEKITEISDPVEGVFQSFGSALSADLNGSTVSISPLVAGNRVGRVEVFNQNNNSSWVHAKTLWSDNNETTNSFGIDQKIKDNFLIVGAPGESTGGQAYIFERNESGEWSSNPTVLTTSLSPGDDFGHTVEINESFAFVGAKNGDGNVTDTGAVYIFKLENNSWIETAKLIPPTDENEQGFSSDLKVLDDLIIVTAPGVGTSGMGYVYKMHDSNSSDWRLISTLDNNGSTLLDSQSLPVTASRGFIILGSHEDSATSDLAGSCKGFYNHAWQEHGEIAVDPLFFINTPNSFEVLEDYLPGISYTFQTEHPIESNFSWTVSSGTAPSSQYTQLPVEGNFSYIPEGNFSGVHSFTIQSQSINGNQSQTFDINVTSQPDSPIFDSNQTSELNATWIGEDVSFTINVIDADGDALIISAGSLPAGLNISGNVLSGQVTDDGLLDGASSKNLDIHLSVSDGTGTVDATKTFTLTVYARNLPPEIFDQHGASISSISVTLPEDFSQSDWLDSIGSLEFRDDQTTSGFSIISVSTPNNGITSFDPDSSISPIIYTPNQDFVGTDTFDIELYDSSVPSKSVGLLFNITTTAVNDPPDINSSLIATAAEGIDFTYLIDWEDIDGDTGHAVHVSGLPEWLDFNASANTLNGKPNWNDYKASPDEVTLTVTDPGGLSDSKILLVRVIPINYPPTFYNEDNETRFTDEDVSLRIPLTYYDLSDDPNESVEWQVLEQPSYGDITLDIQGSAAFIDYTPDGNFSGIDNVRVKIFNPPVDSNSSDTLTIPISIRSVEDNPVISSVPKYTDAVVGYEWYYNYFAVDGDVNQSVTFSNIPLDVSWLNTVDDSDGNITKASIRGKPDVGDVGEFEVTLGVVDNTGLHGAQTFSVNVLLENAPPVINEGESLNVEMVEDGYWEMQNPLTCTDQNNQRLLWEVVAEPSNGEVVITTDEDDFSFIKYSPIKNFYGNDFVTIEVSDGIDTDEFTYYFTILSADDTPIFTSNQNGLFLSYEDGDLVQQLVTFIDGDNDLNKYEILSKPDWLSVNESNFTSGELYLSGSPAVEDEGNSTFEVKVIDHTDLFSTLSFDIKVVVLNYPPQINVEFDDLDIDEDQGSAKLIDLTVSDEDQSSGHVWSIINGPNHGDVSFSAATNLQSVFYAPHNNYYGNDQFTVRVDDSGTTNGDSKFDEVSFTINISPVEDVPAILTSPPKEAYEDQPFSYQFEATDGDMPEDELIVTAASLPSWLKFEDQGNGQGKLHGNASISDAGLHRIKINVFDLAGNTTTQTFLLNLIVRDFPPVFKSLKTSTVLKNITLYLKEDEEISNWTNPKGFMAVNPDPDSDDYAEINWSIARNSIIGSNLSVGGAGGKPSLFKYTPPKNFSGIDYFSLIMDEGDRTTEIDFEIRVSEVPDPPYFITALQSSYIVNESDLFELKILAGDVDSQEIQCRLVGPSWEVDPWLSVDEGNITGEFFLRGVPQVGVNGKVFPYTIVLIDDTGLISNQGITFDVNGVNSPPSIIPTALQVIFSQDGVPISNYESMRAIDLDGDILMWSLIDGVEYTDGEIVVEGNGSLPDKFLFKPTAIKSNYDKFEIKSTDGVSSDSIVIEPIVNWDNNLTVSGVSGPISIKETQGFSQIIFVNSSNELADIEMKILHRPEWVNISQGTDDNYEISGVAPIGSAGVYSMVVSVRGEGSTEEVDFEINVTDGRPPKIILQGDSVVRISNLRPFQEGGYDATDARSNDLTSDVKVTEGGTDDYGFSKMEYEVADIFGNKAHAGRLIKEYEGSALVLSENRIKFLGESKEYGWRKNDEVDIISSSFQTLEINGELTDAIDLKTSSWISLASDFSAWRVNSEFFAENVSLVKVARSPERTYIAGDFSGLLTVSSKRVSSDFNHSTFLAAYSDIGELVWIKTIGTTTPLNNLSLLVDNGGDVVLAGNYSSDLYFDDYANSLESNASNFFVCRFSAEGDLSTSKSIPLILGSKLKSFKSFGGDKYVALTVPAGSVANRAHFLTIDETFKVLDEFWFDSNESVSVHDFEVSNNRLFIGGDFSGAVSSEQQLVFSSMQQTAFIISADSYGNLSWARSFPSSGVSSIRDVEIDYWGDLLVVQEFSGEINHAIGSLVAKGGYDLQLSLLDADDGGQIWDKHIGGDGNETVNSLKLNSYGTPFLFFQTSLGLYQDDVAFSQTTSEEIHGVALLPKTGLPIITTEKLEIENLGSFSFQLNALHPEYLFFEIKSGPSWMELTEIDGANGTAQISGNTQDLLLEDIENVDDLSVVVFTIDGAYKEKKIPVTFKRNEQLDRELGLLPEKNDNSYIALNRRDEFSHVLGVSDFGWVVAGRFPEESTNASNYNYKLKYLSEDMTLTEIISIHSGSPVHLADLKVSKEGTVFLYGNFSDTLSVGSKVLSSRGSSDLFILEVDQNGTIIQSKQFGHVYAEKAGGILVNEENLIICGSFNSSTKFGGNEYTAKGNSSDSFVAQIDRLNFYDFKWVNCFGESGDDYANDIVPLKNNQSVVGVVGEVDNQADRLTIPKMFFRLIQLDDNGSLVNESNYFSSGRINNGLLARAPASNLVVFSFEFEKELSWANGNLSSNGGFDIFNSSTENGLLSSHYSSIGGPWNDRLTSMSCVGLNSYVVASSFYQNIKVGNETFQAMGSSDALISKMHTENHRLFDNYHLSTVKEDRIDVLGVMTDEFMLVGGKTYSPITKTEQSFLNTFGEKPNKPRALNAPPTHLNSSFPFDFTIYTESWSDKNGTFEVSLFDEEKNYKWIHVEIDSLGNVRFHGIAPNFETIIPFDFSIIETQSDDDLRLKFNLELSTEENVLPELDIPKEIVMFEGENKEVEFKIFDLDGDDVDLHVEGPSWAKVQRSQADQALLILDNNNTSGEFDLKIFASDNSGESNMFKVKLILNEIEDNQDIDAGNSENNNSLISNRLDFENGWSFHYQLGWLFLEEIDNDSFWLWKEGWGWLWTEHSLWENESSGYLYRSDISSWVFWTENGPSPELNAYDFKNKVWSQF